MKFPESDLCHAQKFSNLDEFSRNLSESLAVKQKCLNEFSKIIQ